MESKIVLSRKLAVELLRMAVKEKCLGDSTASWRAADLEKLEVRLDQITPILAAENMQRHKSKQLEKIDPLPIATAASFLELSQEEILRKRNLSGSRAGIPDDNTRLYLTRVLELGLKTFAEFEVCVEDLRLHPDRVILQNIPILKSIANHILEKGINGKPIDESKNNTNDPYVNDPEPLEGYHELISKSIEARISEFVSPFRGRDLDLKALEQFINTRSEGYFFVFGPPGIGKSSLMAQFATRMEGQHGDSINVIPYFLRKGNASVKRTTFLTYLNTQLEEVVNLHLPISSNSLTLEIDLHRRLKAVANQDKKIVLLIDGLDEGEEEGIEKLISSGKYENVYIFYFTRRTDAVTKIFLPLNQNQEVGQLNLLGLDAPALDRIIASLEQEPSIPEECYPELKEKSQGNPKYFEMLGKLMKTKTIVILSINDIPRYVESFENFYEPLLDTYSRRDTGGHVYKVMQLLSVAKDSLEIWQIAQILELDDAVVFRTLTVAKEVISIEKQSELEYHQLFHKTLEEFLINKFPNSMVDMAEKIVRFCRSWKSKYELRKMAYRYVMHNYSFHLSVLGKSAKQYREELYELALDQSFIDAQFEITQESEPSFKLVDFALADAINNRQFERVVSLGAQDMKVHSVLGSDKRELLQEVEAPKLESIRSLISRLSGLSGEDKNHLFSILVYQLTLGRNRKNVQKLEILQEILKMDEMFVLKLEFKHLPLIIEAQVLIEMTILGLRTSRWAIDWLHTYCSFKDSPTENENVFNSWIERASLETLHGIALLLELITSKLGDGCLRESSRDWISMNFDRLLYTVASYLSAKGDIQRSKQVASWASDHRKKKSILEILNCGPIFFDPDRLWWNYFEAARQMLALDKLQEAKSFYNQGLGIINSEKTSAYEDVNRRGAALLIGCKIDPLLDTDRKSEIIDSLVAIAEKELIVNNDYVPLHNVCDTMVRISPYSQDWVDKAFACFRKYLLIGRDKIYWYDLKAMYREFYFRHADYLIQNGYPDVLAIRKEFLDESTSLLDCDEALLPTLVRTGLLAESRVLVEEIEVLVDEYIQENVGNLDAKAAILCLRYWIKLCRAYFIVRDEPRFSKSISQMEDLFSEQGPLYVIEASECEDLGIWLAKSLALVDLIQQSDWSSMAMRLFDMSMSLLHEMAEIDSEDYWVSHAIPLSLKTTLRVKGEYPQEWRLLVKLMTRIENRSSDGLLSWKEGLTFLFDHQQLAEIAEIQRHFLILLGSENPQQASLIRNHLLGGLLPLLWREGNDSVSLLEALFTRSAPIHVPDVQIRTAIAEQIVEGMIDEGDVDHALEIVVRTEGATKERLESVIHKGRAVQAIEAKDSATFSKVLHQIEEDEDRWRVLSELASRSIIAGDSRLARNLITLLPDRYWGGCLSDLAMLHLRRGEVGVALDLFDEYPELQQNAYLIEQLSIYLAKQGRDEDCFRVLQSLDDVDDPDQDSRTILLFCQLGAIFRDLNDQDSIMYIVSFLKSALSRVEKRTELQTMINFMVSGWSWPQWLEAASFKQWNAKQLLFLKEQYVAYLGYQGRIQEALTMTASIEDGCQRDQCYENLISFLVDCVVHHNFDLVSIAQKIQDIEIRDRALQTVIGISRDVDQAIQAIGQTTDLQHLVGIEDVVNSCNWEQFQKLQATAIQQLLMNPDLYYWKYIVEKAAFFYRENPDCYVQLLNATLRNQRGLTWVVGAMHSYLLLTGSLEEGQAESQNVRRILNIL